MDNLIFLFGAYSIAWVAVALYIFINTKRLKSVENKIEDIQERLNRQQ